ARTLPLIEKVRLSQLLAQEVLVATVSAGGSDYFKQYFEGRRIAGAFQSIQRPAHVGDVADGEQK
ncbi:MAG TPA: hypothetical protein PLQ88_32035, partial [Blastocatellia bacterium]|nr:hypothetical protein [Blastocatellia bacterium]HNG32064.1 hypothetical protein [Blastocatellia bacterium]